MATRELLRSPVSAGGGNRDVGIAFAVCAVAVVTGALGPHWSTSIVGISALFGSVIAALSWLRREHAAHGD
jgi:hypothetical protein